MSELTRPFVRLWNWVDYHGGFPGKMFFIMMVILMILLFFMWLNNRKAG